MKLVSILIICAALGVAQTPPPPGQLDASPALFSVMSAINAAGYDFEADSPTNHGMRKAMRDYLAKQNLPVLSDLKDFVKQHKKANPTAELSQYISFALSTTGPPTFEYTFKEHEIPLDVLALSGFQSLMVRFHKEANMDMLWENAQKNIDPVIERYHEPTVNVIREANGYLRNVTSGYLGRRFQIFIDVLAAPNNIQTRAYKDDFFVVFTNSVDAQIDYVRYAYLQYLIDPLSIKYAAVIEKKRALGDFAKAAGALDDHYKEDFLLLTSACVIKAVEARLRGKEGPALVDTALREGFILTPHFYEQLGAYEKAEQSFRLYYPDLINSIDLFKEDKRLEKVQFLSAKTIKKAKVATIVEPPPVEGVAKTLDEGEDLYRANALDMARTKFLKAMEQSDEKPAHAKAYYGLARVALKQGNPAMAERDFDKVLGLEPDPETMAWAHYYLGRLEDAAGVPDKEKAEAHYREVLKIKGASEMAIKNARQGLSGAFRSGKPKK